MQMSPELVFPLPSRTPPSSSKLKPLDGFIKEKKKKRSSLDFKGWHFKWFWRCLGEESRIMMSIVMQNRKVRGYYQLFEGETEGPRPAMTPEIILKAMTRQVWTVSHLLKRRTGADIFFFIASGTRKIIIRQHLCKFRTVWFNAWPWKLMNGACNIRFPKGHPLWCKCAVVT